MIPQTAEGLDEITETKIEQRRPEYREYLQGKQGETKFTYVVPQEGISREAARAIEQRTAVYEQFTQQIRGIGMSKRITVIREDVDVGWKGFSAAEHAKYAQLSPGERITFKIRGSGELELAALDEIKTTLEKGAYQIWMK